MICELFRIEKLLNTEVLDSTSPVKRIHVEALDFDWIFEKGNAVRFLELVDEAADKKFE